MKANQTALKQNADVVKAYVEWLASKARLELERQGNTNPTDNEICKCVNKNASQWER
jgi:hypothetical protein